MANIPYDPVSLAVNTSMPVIVEGISILVCRSQKQVYAVRNRCPHQALGMEGARVRGESVICPHHGARFSLADGKSLSALTQNPLPILPCRIEGDRLDIDLSALR